MPPGHEKWITTNGAIRSHHHPHKVKATPGAPSFNTDFDRQRVEGLEESQLMAELLTPDQQTLERNPALDELERRYGWQQVSTLLTESGTLGRVIATTRWGSWLGRPTLTDGPRDGYVSPQPEEAPPSDLGEPADPGATQGKQGA